MLTIPQTLPIKRMTLYGSTAMLVGFTSTFAMLREFAPKDSPSGGSIVQTINKKPTKTTANGVEAKQGDDKSAPSAAALPDQGGLVVRSGNPSTQQTPRVSTTSPTYIAPIASSSAPVQTSTTSAPAPVVTSGGGGNTSTSPTTTTQPAPTQPSSPLPSTSGLQDTVNSVTKSTNLLP
ncbi:MAG: hypothetical protein JWM07_630 [Candidatus Saccharibacteria bacterium]|jgi:hypothetical protein|nr:hypothetical protein [Candidatus Saccharibacteria bacterium]